MDATVRDALHVLFENSPPVLIEVRFPKAGTSPDWYLCEDEKQFEQILERLAPGVEVRASSVWDLRNAKGVVCLNK